MYLVANKLKKIKYPSIETIAILRFTYNKMLQQRIRKIKFYELQRFL